MTAVLKRKPAGNLNPVILDHRAFSVIIIILIEYLSEWFKIPTKFIFASTVLENGINKRDCH